MCNCLWLFLLYVTFSLRLVERCCREPSLMCSSDSVQVNNLLPLRGQGFQKPPNWLTLLFHWPEFYHMFISKPINGREKGITITGLDKGLCNPASLKYLRLGKRWHLNKIKLQLSRWRKQCYKCLDSQSHSQGHSGIWNWWAISPRWSNGRLSVIYLSLGS